MESPLRRCWVMLLVAGTFATSDCVTRGNEDAIKEDEQVLKSAGVGSDGPALLQFIRKRTLTQADQQRVADLVKQLGDQVFRVRVAAAKRLIGMGPLALPALRLALTDSDSEVRSKAKTCIVAIEKQNSPAVVLAVVHLIRVRKPNNGCRDLLTFLPFAEREVQDEIIEAVREVGIQAGKAEVALVAALQSKNAVQRAAAAAALGQSGNQQEKLAVRKLLGDADHRVRFYAAKGLFLGKDKSGVTTLVALLSDGPMELAQQAEELLVLIGDEKLTKTELTADAAARKKLRDAWAAWWNMNQAKVDLAKLVMDSQSNRPHQAKLIAKRCLDAFIGLEMAKFKKTLGFPFFMQSLGRDSNNQFACEKEIDQIFQLLKSIPDWQTQLKQLSFEIKRVGRVDEYMKSAQQLEKPFLSKYRQADTLIVYISSKRNGREQGGGAIFVHFKGGKARVIGFGNGSNSRKR